MAKILVIEDDPDSRDLARYALELAGHDVQDAATAEAGIEVARGDRPDLVVLDLSLPGALDGLQAARIMKSDPALAAIPLVAVTAQAMRVDRARAMDAGFDEFFVKPMADLEAFCAAVDRLAVRGET